MSLMSCVEFVELFMDLSIYTAIKLYLRFKKFQLLRRLARKNRTSPTGGNGAAPTAAAPLPMTTTGPPDEVRDLFDATPPGCVAPVAPPRYAENGSSVYAAYRAAPPPSYDSVMPHMGRRRQQSNAVRDILLNM